MRRSAPQWHIMGDNVHSRWDGVWWRPFPIYNSSVISVASITQWQPPYNIRDIYRTPCWTNNRGTLEVTQTHNWHLVKNETLIKSYFNSCKNSSNYKKVVVSETDSYPECSRVLSMRLKKLYISSLSVTNLADWNDLFLQVPQHESECEHYLVCSFILIHFCNQINSAQVRGAQ